MVVTRFAPSPTGLLHLGNARTAIFSYLFARHHGGRFILRVEDTDRERSKREFEEAILEDLKWLGLEWDEFYRQSERFGVYSKYIEELLEKGYAYPCFCTEEELERERRMAELKRVPYRYSGKCRNLSEKEIERLKAEGRPYTIRFRVPDGRTVVFEDLIKGKIAINVDDFGDFIIVRSDGTPTYNLAVVIDDALMGVTHVLRGEDHISNTPKQILIYEALRLEPPKFAHLPVILGPDRSKLSKRHGAVSVSSYREEGFLPEALFNYLCLLGWSPPEGDREIFSKEELIEIFDLKDINRSPAVFNLEKLRWMNGVYIREVVSLERLYETALPFLKEAGYGVDDEAYVKKVLQLTRDSYETFRDMVRRLRPFFADRVEIPERLLGLLKEMDAFRVFDKVLEDLDGADISSPEKVKEFVKGIIKDTGLKPRQVWHSLRIALTGEEEGIGVDILLSVLPKERIRQRLEEAISCLR